MTKSEVANRYQLLHLVHQGYLGALWVGRGTSGEVTDSPALVRRIQLPAGLSDEQLSAVSEAAWDSLELHHDNLLKVAEVVFADGVFAMAYDYVEAEVLQALLLMGTVKKTPLAPDVVARILLDVVNGLEALAEGAQALGLNPHGGVTPESIVVGSDGCSRLVEGLVGAVASSFAPVRSSTNRVGYCSPEQLRGEAVDEQSDVFALGVLLAELLAGRRLLLGAASAIEQKLVEGKLPQISAWLKPERGIEANLLAVLDRATLANRAQRTPTLRALADEFCAALPAVASHAQLGAAVHALAAKQLEVRGRKLASNRAPRLSQRVGQVRGDRPSRAPVNVTQLAVQGLKAPRAVHESNLEADPGETEAPTLAPAKAEPESSRDVPTPRAPMTTLMGLSPDALTARVREGFAEVSRVADPLLDATPSAPAANGAAAAPAVDAADVDELLVSLGKQEEPDDMQSGTHRKVLTTLIGVAPPPKPMIGGSPPPLAIPTQVVVNTAPSVGRRNEAGIADLLRTAVPAKKGDGRPAGARSTAEEAGSVTPAVVSTAVSPLPAAAKEAQRHPEYSAPPPAESAQLVRYRRLTVLFGATTVLLATVLGWLLFEVLNDPHIAQSSSPQVQSQLAKEPPAAPAPVSSGTPQVVAGPMASVESPAPPSDAPSAASAGASTAAQNTAKPPAVRPRAPQKKPTKQKVYVPDDI